LLPDVALAVGCSTRIVGGHAPAHAFRRLPMCGIVGPIPTGDTTSRPRSRAGRKQAIECARAGRVLQCRYSGARATGQAASRRQRKFFLGLFMPRGVRCRPLPDSAGRRFERTERLLRGGAMAQSGHWALRSTVVGVLKREVQSMSGVDIGAKLSSLKSLPPSVDGVARCGPRPPDN
jgi:hypothetical protein